MPRKKRSYVDDCWAVWIDGEDTSTVYINDWINPNGKSYVDLAIRIRGVKSSKNLYVYVPFELSRGEMEDISLLYKDTRILQATFSAVCIVDYMKNEHTSEIAYNGKTVDIVKQIQAEAHKSHQPGEHTITFLASRTAVSRFCPSCGVRTGRTDPCRAPWLRTGRSRRVPAGLRNPHRHQGTWRHRWSPRPCTPPVLRGRGT